MHPCRFIPSFKIVFYREIENTSSIYTYFFFPSATLCPAVLLLFS